MGKRKTYDWEAIEREFRANQLSIREIARQHGCSDGAIRKKMKELGVERDLSKKVAEKVRNELVRTEVRTANPQTEKEIVEVAAARSVEVVRGHRAKLSHGSSVVEKLFGQLDEVCTNREEIEEEIEEDTKNDENPQRRNMMLRAVSLQSNASTAVSLSAALKNLITLERQAFNLDDDKQGYTEKKLSEIADEIDGITIGLPNDQN